MTRYMNTGVVLAVALSAAACTDFLSKATEDPNNPIEATAQQQLIAFQANMNVRLEGQLARNAAIYTQQIIGTNNQQLQQGTAYGIAEGDVNFMTPFYTGSGLVALRNIQAYGQANSDPFLLGIAKVWEGFAFGMLTSAFGDLPYSQANDPAFLTPVLDPQQQIYAEVQTRLDEGIAALQTVPTTSAVEPSDLIYGAGTPPPTRTQQISRWIAAAHTMKARFHLHLVERNGNTAYQAALAEAALGINEVPGNVADAMHGRGPGDFRTFHGSTIDVDGNSWAQFLTARAGDLGASNSFIQLLQSRGDPRISAYYSPSNTAGEFFGADQNAALVGAGPIAQINLPVRRALNFRQPIVTWAENQLIRAEAEFVLNGAAAALPFVNAVRNSVGLASLGSVTFDDVMLEKYIAQFQNIDVWNDYKRTCIPTLVRNGTAAEIPGRIPYQLAERNANPNVPLPSAYPAGTTGVSRLRNWNDPNPCP